MAMPEHILSLSYGKDSLACLGAIEQLGWPLDRIVHAEVWATDTIPADLPPMVSSGVSFERGFYFRRGRTGRITKFYGKMYGWPMQRGQWCLQQLKLPALNKIGRKGIQYIGIAADEPNRFHNLSDTKKSPIVEVGWTESDCRRWCEENDLLSPIYTTGTRGGCWFCHNQGVQQLRLLRENYPDLWTLMLKWDEDSPVTFHADGHTVHDFDRRFALEDDGLIYPDDKVFLWSMLDDELNYRWF